MNNSSLAKSLLLLPVLFLISTSAAAQEKTTQIYEVKWRNHQDVGQMLVPFIRGGDMVANEAFNTLTITASADQHAMIEGLIRRFDVPARTIQFQFYILRASRTGSGIKNGLPEEIRSVVQEVGALTRYTQFELLDSPLIRAHEGSPSHVSGKTEYLYYLELGEPHVTALESAPARIRVEGFQIQFQVPSGAVDREGNPVAENVNVATAFSLADEETIVLGASRISAGRQPSDEAVITVVTAKIL